VDGGDLADLFPVSGGLAGRQDNSTFWNGVLESPTMNVAVRQTLRRYCSRLSASAPQRWTEERVGCRAWSPPAAARSDA